MRNTWYDTRTGTAMAWRKGMVLTVALGAMSTAACGGDDGDETAATTSPAVASTAIATSEPATIAPTSPPTSETSAPPSTAATSASVVTTAPPTTAPAGPSGAELRAAVETGLASETGTALLLDRMAELDVPGIAVAVVADGEIVTSFGAGTTPDGRAMESTTLLQVGSVSKPIAAIAAVSLVADGTLPWDAPIDPFLTGFTLPPGAQTADAPVTLARLLSHTAGTNVGGFLGYASVESAPTRPEVLRGEGDTEPLTVVATPGAGYVYSGGGYELAAQAMLDASSPPTFDALVRERVLEPAGMTSTFYALDPPVDLLDGVSIGSVNGDPLAQGWQRHPEEAAAGVWTNADDPRTTADRLRRSPRRQRRRAPPRRLGGDDGDARDGERRARGGQWLVPRRRRGSDGVPPQRSQHRVRRRGRRHGRRAASAWWW
jgi:CubicO group peptidase (beta-lactamase class C family)